MSSIIIQSVSHIGETANIIFKPSKVNVVINLGNQILPYEFDPTLLSPPRNVYGTYTILVEGSDCPIIMNVPEPTPTPTPTPTITRTSTPTVTPTMTPTPTFDPCKVPTPTPTVTKTQTPTLTVTPTRTPTPTFDPCKAPTPSITPTNTVTPTITSTITLTPTVTPTNTVTQTITSTITLTPTVTLTSTNTLTPTSTPTPTLTLAPLNLELFVEYSPGSIIASYTLLLNRPYNEEINVTFENVLNFYSGSPITIFTGVTVSLGSLSGQTIVTIDEDYNNYTGEPLFSQLSGTPVGSTWEIFVIPTATPTATPTPTFTSTPTPTPTSTPIIPPLNDLTYLIIPDNDLRYVTIPDSDLTYLLIPNNDLIYSIIPNNDINYLLIPNSDVRYSLIPNNDLTYEILSCTGKTFNLVLFPYQPPSEGNIIFPNFNEGSGTATLNPNTFTEGGVYWNEIDRNGDNSYSYFENLQNPFVLTFTQGIRYASYSGYSGAINYVEGLFFNDGNGGLNPEPQPQLTLITPSIGNFNLTDSVCISYINIDVPNPTPTPTPTETSTPTPTPTLTPTPTPTQTSIPVNLIMDLDSTTGITNSDWYDNTEYNNNATINGGFSLDTYNGYQVVSFNGTNTFVFPTNGFGTSLDTSGFTFEVWAYPTTTSDGTLIVEWSGFPPTGWNDAQMAFVNGTINSGVFDPTSFSPTPYITGPTFSANTWYNIVMTYNGETLSQYVNGVNVGETSGVKLNPDGTYLSLGRTDTANSYLGGASGYFQGYIGLWKIWEGPLSSSQVLTNYNTYKSRYGL
jgi:hypothetical protein